MKPIYRIKAFNCAMAFALFFSVFSMIRLLLLTFFGVSLFTVTVFDGTFLRNSMRRWPRLYLLPLTI